MYYIDGTCVNNLSVYKVYLELKKNYPQTSDV